MPQSAITRVITVASGRFAPGHLGELTQIVPFEMVDAVLAETGAVQSRLRETCYLKLKSTILGGQVLRACTPPGVAQEIYALLTDYPPGCLTRS